ncbi:MAG: carbohydrate-binding module family 20 domain-containing protein [Ignavibacteria bacterium]|nr:carbohydrate-binding module family 20 domain-containing protein [Ignavibacteria bacterium]
MLKLKFLLMIFPLLCNLLFAQKSLDSLMYSYQQKFWSEKEYVFVQGKLCDSFSNELNNVYEDWKKNPNFIVKYEDQLDSTDLSKHLNFWGPIKSYKYLDKYLPSALTLTGNGFKLGSYLFNDSLDAISIISSGGNRRFQLGNFFEGTKTLWTTFQDISQYFVMQNYAITHHGFLNANKFDEERNYNVAALRNKQLKKYETKYYTFSYDPQIFSKNQNADSLFLFEDTKLDDVIKRLHFAYPERKIECYLYKDLEQKYCMSATPGFGNPFPKAFQNHSIGFGPAEHESIHVLFGNASTIFSEGIVGYYYSTKDSVEWKRTKSTVSRHPDFSMKNFLNNSNNFDFSQLSYAASAHFAKYLIDTYGLEKFKSAASFEDMSKGFRENYNKSLDEIVEGWNAYFQNNKVELGAEREIVFKVIANTIPDTSSIYIVGDNVLIGMWDAGSIKLIKQNDGSWTRKFIFAEGTILNYKITRGSWDTEALDEKGNVPPNSVLEVKGNEMIVINVKKWKDLN